MEPIFPNGQKSFDNTHETLSQLIHDYGVDVSGKEVLLLTMEFERLNFKLKWKPNTEAWEERIVSFAESKANQIKNEAQYNPPQIIRYNETEEDS